MKIFITRLLGKTTSLEVNPSDTIKMVKEKYYKKEGVSPSQQQLIYRGKVLEDNSTLSDYHVMNESKFHVEILLRNEENNFIYVKTLLGKTISIDFNQLDSIKNLKEEIYKKEGIPVLKQKLVYAGKDLEDNLSFSNYNIRKGSTLHLLPRSTNGVIFIKSDDGKKMLTLDVNFSDSIKILKDSIYKKEGISQDNQNLFFSGKELKDIFTLSYYNIKNESTLQLVIRKENNEQLIKKINILENELKEEKMANKILEEKINALTKELEEKNNIIKNLTKNKKDKNINSISDKKSKEELYNIIIEKDKEIKDLKLTISRYPFELKKGEKLITVNFMSVDNKIQNYSLICKNTDTFNIIEKMVYDEYKEFYETENYFTVNGKKINKYKNLEENNIHNNDVIILNVLDI